MLPKRSVGGEVACPNVPCTFHAGYTAWLNIVSELHKHWRAILGLNQSALSTDATANTVARSAILVPT